MCCVGQGYSVFALCCKIIHPDSNVQSSAPTQTLTRGDWWSHTGTSCFRGVCSTPLYALGEATSASLQSYSFALFCSEETRLRAAITLQTSNLSAVLCLPWVAESQGGLPLEAQGHRCQEGGSFRQKCH